MSFISRYRVRNVAWDVADCFLEYRWHRKCRLATRSTGFWQGWEGHVFGLTLWVHFDLDLLPPIQVRVNPCESAKERRRGGVMSLACIYEGSESKDD